MNNFFFIPASKIHKITTIRNLGIEDIIIDLEDSVKFSEVDKHIKNILHLKCFDYFIRVPVKNEKEELDLSFLEILLKSSVNKITLPKVKNIQEFSEIYKICKKNERDKRKVQIILLIEYPNILLNLTKVLEGYSDLICGIALGSHDFMVQIGGEHKLERLDFYRQTVLLSAKAYNKIAIDIASMKLNSEEVIKKEILDGFEMGYDAKFLIHPKQYEVFKSIEFYSSDDLKWAEKVWNRLSAVKSVNDFEPVVIDGNIIEKPHLDRAKKIINFFKDGSK